MCYIQQWRHHFKSGITGDKLASGASEINFALHLAESSPMWTLLRLGPPHLHGPLYLHGALSERIVFITSTSTLLYPFTNSFPSTPFKL